MSFLAEYGLFLAKTLTFLIAFLIVLSSILMSSRKDKSSNFIIEDLSEALDTIQKNIYKVAFQKKEKSKKQSRVANPKLFVLDFNGDIHATEVNTLRDMITSILTIATPNDQILLRVESPGGAVSGYGLAASQLVRIREKNIPLVVSIDKIAASGGYLMALVANTIIAAPFAIIGSIGVVAQLPNFHRFLKKHDVDIELITAGKYKRTLTMLGENTEEGREKFKEDLNKIHDAFQHHLSRYRPSVDVKSVATGEHWLASDGILLNLVDNLMTSDEFIQLKRHDHHIILLKTDEKEPFLKRLFKPFMTLFNKALL
jgi:serine protease SohB